MKQFMPITKFVRDMEKDQSIIGIDGTDLYESFMADNQYREINVTDFPGIYPPSEQFVIEVSLSNRDLFGVAYRVRRFKGHINIEQCLIRSDSYVGVDAFQTISVGNDGMIIGRDDFHVVGKIDPGWAEDQLSTLPKRIADTIGSSENLLESMMWARIAGCLHVLSFLGCKNITAEPVDTMQNVRVPRKNPNKFRVEQRPFRYHVLKISSPGASRESHAAASERLTAAHICRGHVKRYTAEKPLLGRHVGAFYFAQHVRGSAEVGVVEKDYKVIQK